MTELLYWTSLLASQENNNSLQASPTQAREVLPGGSLPGRNPSPTKINIGNNGNHVVFFKQNRGWMMTSSYRFFRNISANRVGNHYSLNPSGSGWGVGVEVQKTVGKIRQKTSHLCKIYKDYPPKKKQRVCTWKREAGGIRLFRGMGPFSSFSAALAVSFREGFLRIFLR